MGFLIIVLKRLPELYWQSGDHRYLSSSVLPLLFWLLKCNTLLFICISYAYESPTNYHMWYNPKNMHIVILCFVMFCLITCFGYWLSILEGGAELELYYYHCDFTFFAKITYFPYKSKKCIWICHLNTVVPFDPASMCSRLKKHFIRYGDYVHASAWYFEWPRTFTGYKLNVEDPQGAVTWALKGFISLQTRLFVHQHVYSLANYKNKETPRYWSYVRGIHW